MTSITMSDIAHWIARFKWLRAWRPRPPPQRRPDIGKLSDHLRRDVGLGPDAGP